MKTLSKHQVEALKDAVRDYGDMHGGSFATVKYHKQNRYAEGFVAVYLTDRRVVKVRAYSTGRIYAMTAEGRVLDSCYAEEIVSDK